MCSLCDFDGDVPRWVRSLQSFARDHGAVLAPAVALAATLAAMAGGLFYLLGPTDIERAEAHLWKARAVVAALDDEATASLKEAKGHKLRAADHKKQLDENPDVDDAEWRAWHQAMADGHGRLYRAKVARRDTLMHLAAEYLRLLAEAEGEILRAKDARDRGTPNTVAPRVRDLLAPVMTGR